MPSPVVCARLSQSCCRNLVPTFPQRSPPSLLTTAACGGLRSAPDCRTRRALLHLSYSCAAPVLLALLVTHDPERTLNRLEGRARARSGGCFLETDGSTAFHIRFCFDKLFPTKAV